MAIRKLVEDNVGFYLNMTNSQVQYLAAFGLRPEDFPAEQPVEEPDLDLDSLIAQAQAIWRGNHTRKAIEKDKRKLYLRFWKTCENSMARVSIRDVRILHKVTDKSRETEVTTTTATDGDGKQVGRQQQQKVGEEQITNQSVERLIAYRVEVENWYLDEKGEQKYNKFASD